MGGPFGVLPYVPEESKVGEHQAVQHTAGRRRKPSSISPVVRVWLERVIIPVVVREVLGDEN